MSKVLVIATDALEGPEIVEELRRRLRERAAEVEVVAPAVERSAFRHALGDVDAASREAEERLRRSLEALRRGGIEATGMVGDTDPVLAAEDALREFDADEVLILEHAAEQARWFEEGLFERAQEKLEPPLEMIVLRQEDGLGPAHVVGHERAGAGAAPPKGLEREVRLSENLPSFTRGDLAGIVLGIVGTIVAIILATTGPGAGEAAGAAQILIAIGIALINMAHVVGLVLFESVRYRGGFQGFFRTLSLLGTPAAILANLLLTLFA